MKDMTNSSTRIRFKRKIIKIKRKLIGIINMKLKLIINSVYIKSSISVIITVY